MLGYDLLFNMTCLLLEIKEKSCFKLKLKNIEKLLKNDVLRSVRLKDIENLLKNDVLRLKDIENLFLLYAFKYVIIKYLILETQHVLNVSLSFLLVNFQINLY
jgi:hypothetical protein